MKSKPTPQTVDSKKYPADWQEFDRSSPMSRAFNYLCAGTQFAQKFQRWPLPIDDPTASINDLIFARMIEPQWSPLQRAFVDKTTAKSEAKRLCPDVHVPGTLDIISVEPLGSLNYLYDRLGRFFGTNAIAKPSHASGGTVFLRTVTSPPDLHILHALASIDYACIMREMQYWRLPRKIIVEALVPTADASPPDDYKFHCVHGEPLLCQIDHGRFGKAWSRIFRVPDFEPMDNADGLASPDGFQMPDPDRLAALTATARALAAPFDFVRVDLYDGADGVYFGELTFTPAASLGIAPSSAGCHRETQTHREYSRTLLRAYRKKC